MFGYDNVKVQTNVLSDPTQDGTFLLFRVPSRNTKAEILSAVAWTDTTVTLGNGTGIALTLYDMGSTGTATPGTIAATIGGTAVTWTANVPKAFTISEGTLDGGDYVGVLYNETGTVAPLNLTIQVDWVNGVGA